MCTCGVCSHETESSGGRKGVKYSYMHETTSVNETLSTSTVNQANLPKDEDGDTHSVASESTEMSETALPAFAAGDTPSASRTQFSHILQKDGYQVFKALCKLSEKDVMDGSDAR